MNAQSTLANLKKLIETVRNNPGIYDYKRDDFLVFEKREQCWKNVANSVNLKVPDLKNRWHILRSRYVRYQRKVVLGQIDVSQVQFPFYEQMNFLDPFIKRHNQKRLTRSSTSSIESKKAIKTENGKIVKIKNSVGNTSNRLCNKSQAGDTICLQNRVNYNNNDNEEFEKSENKNNHNIEGFRREETIFVNSASPSPLDESTNQEKMQCPQDDILDEDGLFGKSLGMSLRKLSRLNNARAKAEMFQVLQKYIEFEEV